MLVKRTHISDLLRMQIYVIFCKYNLKYATRFSFEIWDKKLSFVKINRQTTYSVPVCVKLCKCRNWRNHGQKASINRRIYNFLCVSFVSMASYKINLQFH